MDGMKTSSVLYKIIIIQIDICSNKYKYKYIRTMCKYIKYEEYDM